MKKAKGRKFGSQTTNTERRSLLQLMLAGAYTIPLMATMKGSAQGRDDDLLIMAQAKKSKGPPGSFPGKGKFGGKAGAGKGKAKAKGRPF